MATQQPSGTNGPPHLYTAKLYIDPRRDGHTPQLLARPAPPPSASAPQQSSGSSVGRFLTRIMRYFHAPAPPHGNERKTEPSDNEAAAPKLPAKEPLKGAFLPLYGTERARFCDGKRPWMEKTMGRKRKSTGRNGRSTGCFGKSIPRMRAPCPPQGRNLPERRTDAPVRFNALPNGAQGPAIPRNIRPTPPQRKNCLCPGIKEKRGNVWSFCISFLIFVKQIKSFGRLIEIKT